jgi:acetoin utilization deacetylase AcuC-like enzyme/N-acetylglutamate synthase-like GNAT family acetyltransferase
MPKQTENQGKNKSPEAIAWVVNDRQALHDVREPGYWETPARSAKLTAALAASGLFVRQQPRAFGDDPITAVHDPELLAYLRRAGRRMPAGQMRYPSIFPLRHRERLPSDAEALAGYYCFDTSAPVHRGVYAAARRAVDCALTAADDVRAGRRLAYALVRPPGHHAERRAFGGFCYLNNTAIAAQYLSRHGRVAILDIDYHHGNGQQEIFYRRNDVLTVSIHAHPKFAYPYFSGFEDECGAAEGEGFNCNLPLPATVDGRTYGRSLNKALSRIQRFAPQFLVVALGFDTAQGDPVGTWALSGEDFEANAARIGALGLPTLVVQEGGYRLQTLGRNAVHFFQGLARAEARAPKVPPVSRPQASAALRWRDRLAAGDPQAVRDLVARTGFFNPEEVGVAEELVLERLAKGEASGYYFVMAEQQGRLVGYTCYGPIAGSADSFDLYWIAVHPDLQRHGLGRRLMQESERRIWAAGGRRVYVETSHRPIYASTRIFYERCAYRLEAVLEDFYAPGDAKAIYCKVLQ